MKLEETGKHDLATLYGCRAGFTPVVLLCSVAGRPGAGEDGGGCQGQYPDSEPETREDGRVSATRNRVARYCGATCSCGWEPVQGGPRATQGLEGGWKCARAHPRCLLCPAGPKQVASPIVNLCVGLVVFSSRSFVHLWTKSLGIVYYFQMPKCTLVQSRELGAKI